MTEKFSANEIAELGIQTEKNGKEFYDKVSAKSKSKYAREVFKYLSCEEEKHIGIFNEMLSSVHKHEPREAYTEEYFEYMNALAAEYIFTKKDQGAKIAAEIKTEREAVDLGIRFEKDSIIFYEGMRDHGYPGSDDVLAKLVEEEKKHLVELVALRKKMGCA